MSVKVGESESREGGDDLQLRPSASGQHVYKLTRNFAKFGEILREIQNFPKFAFFLPGTKQA